MAHLTYEIEVYNDPEAQVIFEIRSDMETDDMDDIHISTILVLSEAFSSLIHSGEILDRARELAPNAMKVIDDARDD